jgi:N-methylhydantoinase B
VLHDVREGWVSPDRARDVYGVIFSGEGEALVVDEAATERLRTRLASKARTNGEAHGRVKEGA